MMGRAGTIPEQITPCSSEVSNPGYSDTNFGASALSPDTSLVAVEAIYYLDSSFRYSVAIFNSSDQSFIAAQNDVFAPMWLRDGRLLLSSAEGFWVLGSDFETLTRLPDGLTGRVNNPALHPTEDLVAFEFNQQIWLMNSDGSDVREVVFGGANLRYPTWSPDGNALAYLQTDSEDRYNPSISFTDIVNQESYNLDLRPVLDALGFGLSIYGLSIYGLSIYGLSIIDSLTDQADSSLTR